MMADQADSTTTAGTTAAGTTEGAAGKRRSFRRKLVGTVKSDKMQKTVVVEVVRRYLDGKYHKYVRTRERYKAHDENNQFHVGDTVEIQEHRPLSKDKRWVVTRLISTAK
jgi:small subunit ribosomal protein S17